MKNLKKLMMTCLVAGTFAACSSTKTANSGSGGNDSGNMGTGSDTGTTVDTVTSGTRDTMGTASGSGTNATGSIGTQSGTDNTTAPITGNNTTNPTDNLNQNNAMSGTRGATAMARDSSSAQLFLPQAARSSMKEVEISRLALEKSKNPAIRKFAMMMIKTHSDNNQRLMSMGAKKNISMPNMMTGMGTETTGEIGIETSDNKKTDTQMPDTEMPDNPVNPGTQPMDHTASSDLTIFQNLNGAEFDRKYIGQMIQDHEQAIALYTSASQSDDPQVKAHAKKTLPILKSHLTKARDIMDKMD